MSLHAASFLTRSLSADGARAAAWRGAPVFIAMLALLASAFISINSVRAAVAPTPVEDFVQQNVDKGYALLRNKSLSDAERHAQFHTFMLSVSDMRRIGMFALGQYANRVSKPDTDVYLAAFTDYAIPVYETWLSRIRNRFRETGDFYPHKLQAERLPEHDFPCTARAEHYPEPE